MVYAISFSYSKCSTFPAAWVCCQSYASCYVKTFPSVDTVIFSLNVLQVLLIMATIIFDLDDLSACFTLHRTTLFFKYTTFVL